VMLLLTVTEAQPKWKPKAKQPAPAPVPKAPAPKPAPKHYSARMSARGDYYYADYNDYAYDDYDDDDDDYYYDDYYYLDDAAYDSYYDELVASFGEQNVAALFDEELLEDEHYWAGYRAGMMADEMRASMGWLPTWSDVKKKASDYWGKFKNLSVVKKGRQYAFDFCMNQAEMRLVDPMMKEVTDKIYEAKDMALKEINEVLSADLEAKLAKVDQADTVATIKTFISESATHLCGELVAQWPSKVAEAWNHMKKEVAKRVGLSFTPYDPKNPLVMTSTNPSAAAHRAYSNSYFDDDAMMEMDGEEFQAAVEEGKKWAVEAMKKMWSESFSAMIGYSNQQFQSAIDTMKKTVESIVKAKLDELLNKLTSKIKGAAATKLNTAFGGNWKEEIKKFVKAQFDKLSAKLTAEAEKEAKKAFNMAKAKLLGSSYDAAKHDLKARRSPYDRLAAHSRYSRY